jgi:hypothetical protein
MNTELIRSLTKENTPQKDIHTSTDQKTHMLGHAHKIKLETSHPRTHNLQKLRAQTLEYTPLNRSTDQKHKATQR